MKIKALILISLVVSVCSCIGTANVPAPVINGQTELHTVKSKYQAMKLLSNGAFINSQNEFGNTPLHEAFYQNRDEVVDYLLSRGADYLIANFSGITCLDLLLQNNEHHELVKKYNLKKRTGIDTTPPKIRIIFPEIGNGRSRVSKKFINIKGRVTDDSAVASVYVNDNKTKIDKNGHFNAYISLPSEDNLVRVKAFDTSENKSSMFFVINNENQAPKIP